MNLFKRYHYHKTGIRHGGGGVRTSDAAAIERFQQREAMASRARASKAFVWPSRWNTAPGKTTSAANINEINKAFWAKKNAGN